MWDTKLTDYNSMQQGPKRDLVVSSSMLLALRGCVLASTTR
jgi:alpha-L-fucosidase